MKSKFAVVIDRKGTPRLRTTETAFRKTSGKSTAEPQLRYTPPGCISFTSAQKRRKSLWVAEPSAAPSAAGVNWGISLPIAKCTVAGIFVLIGSEKDAGCSV